MYDIMIIGQITLDHNIDFDGREEFRTGGAVTFSGYAAAAIGHRVAVVPKGDPQRVDPFATFRDSKVEKVFPVFSPTCTEMEPAEPARIYHLGGLVKGDMGGDLIEACAKRGDTALDVQAVLRCRNEDGTLELRDWPEKKQYLPLIRYLKTDAAEAEVLTGTDDREKAAFLLCEWGAKEVLITHNTEAIVCDGQRIYRAPLKPRNLSGRTGRGDTTFAGYLTERLDHDIPAALEFAAALVSLKMETPGPFMGTRQDVLDYIERFYR